VSIISISGNLESLKGSLLDEIEALYDLEIDKGDFLPNELTERLADLTSRINREIAVYLDRKGNIVDISVGDSSTVSLPEVEGRKASARLSGIRCVHTHPNGEGMLSSVDTNSLLCLRLDAMVAVGCIEGKVTEIYASLPLRDEDGEFNKFEIYGPFTIKNNKIDSLFDIIAEREKEGRGTVYTIEAGEERAILVGLETLHRRSVDGKNDGEQSLEELAELAFTAGAGVVHKVLQKKSMRDAAYYIGKGKVEELGLLRQALSANLIIFDDELSGAQTRNIEDIVGVRVIDRTTLILDIFAQRARSREGKLQVELAQLKYRLPRLIGLGNQLSRLGGGIGTRGPGEKKLEVDRRHIRRRLSYLEQQLREIAKRRDFIREGRRKNTIPTVALVGYTNVGKSTLMNRLCGSDVLAENKLFATLDPTTRSLNLLDGREALLIDTVGFIRKLPHELVKAFKSTLEEAVQADILIHVLDASSDEAEVQFAVANEILGTLGALKKPMILALNKIDQIDDKQRPPIKYNDGKALEISAVTGQGLDELLKCVSEILPKDEKEIEILAPFIEGWVTSYMHQNGKVLSEEYCEDGIKIKAVVKKVKIDKIKEFIV
jgi:GTPase